MIGSQSAKGNVLLFVFNLLILILFTSCMDGGNYIRQKNVDLKQNFDVTSNDSSINSINDLSQSSIESSPIGTLPPPEGVIDVNRNNQNLNQSDVVIVENLDNVDQEVLGSVDRIEDEIVVIQPPSNCISIEPRELNLSAKKYEYIAYTLRFINTCQQEARVSFLNVSNEVGESALVRYNGGSNNGQTPYVGKGLLVPAQQTVSQRFLVGTFSKEGLTILRLNHIADQERQVVRLSISITSPQADLGDGGSSDVGDSDEIIPSSRSCSLQGATEASQRYIGNSGGWSECSAVRCGQGYYLKNVKFGLNKCESIPTRCTLRTSYSWHGGNTSKTCEYSSSSGVQLDIGEETTIVDNDYLPNTNTTKSFAGDKIFHCWGDRTQSDTDNGGLAYDRPMVGTGPIERTTFNAPIESCVQKSGPKCSPSISTTLPATYSTSVSVQFKSNGTLANRAIDFDSFRYLRASHNGKNYRMKCTCGPNNSSYSSGSQLNCERPELE